MKAGIFLVGTELLNGATIDTNSIYIAEELNKYGIEIEFKMTVRDVMDEIVKALKYAKKNVDLVILTGGLGPTDDDITKEAMAKFLKKKLVVDEKEKKELLKKYKSYKNPNKTNFKEVEKPEGAISFKNDVGMAPAVYVDGLVAFPGFPNELKNMFPKFLKHYVKENNLKTQIYIKDIITYGIGESTLENTVKSFNAEKGEVALRNPKNNKEVARIPVKVEDQDAAPKSKKLTGYFYDTERNSVQVTADNFSYLLSQASNKDQSLILKGINLGLSDAEVYDKFKELFDKTFQGKNQLNGIVVNGRYATVDVRNEGKLITVNDNTPEKVQKILAAMRTYLNGLERLNAMDVQVSPDGR